MKIGIYIWRHKDENRYCIGEWNLNKKQYENLSDLDGAKFRIEQEIKSKDGTSKYAMSDIKIEFAEELKSVSLNKQEPLIAKNESLTKLKKELQKLPSKSKAPKELNDKKFQEQAFQAFIDIFNWVKYAYGSIENVSDFVEKIKSFSQNYQAYFGFSDELVNAMIAVIEGSEKKF